MRTAQVVRIVILLVGWVLAGAGAARAGTVTGTVRNGTTGAPAAGVEVILLQLQNGMVPAATTRADAQGRFRFDRPEIGAQPMLLRVPYKGVDYHQPLPPGKTTADVEVFEPTKKVDSVSVLTRAIVFQPNGPNLMVGEEYRVQNQTQPPVAFYRPDGTFEFALPQGAELNQVSAWGSAGMPIVQGTMDKGKNMTAIAFPFRPGENGVRLSYQLPYPSDQATIQTIALYSVQHVFLLAPPQVEISAKGFMAAGSEQGMNIYVRDSVAANTPLVISVSGTAPLLASKIPNSDGDAGNPSVNSRAEEGNATIVPGRLSQLKWVLLGGFGALFTLGVISLWRRPPAAAVGAPGGSVRDVPGVAADLDRKVQGSLDALKDALFKLELRRQAGTISEEDYTRERRKAEKILRDLVKG